MPFLILLGAGIVITIWVFIAIQFGKIAEDKGYDKTSYGLWTGFLGIIGMLMVCALPDRKKPAPIIIKDETNAIKPSESTTKADPSDSERRQSAQEKPIIPTPKTTIEPPRNTNISVVWPRSVKDDPGMVICPKCGKKQIAGRYSCVNCMVRFSQK